MGPTQKLLWKLYAGVLGTLVTVVTQRLVKLSWKAATGEDPPAPTDPRTPVAQAVIWSIASAVGVGVAQLLTQRFAARHWSNEIGADTPPGNKIKVKI